MLNKGKNRVESIIIGQNNLQILSKVVEKSNSPNKPKPPVEPIQKPLQQIEKRKSEGAAGNSINQPVRA